MVDPYYGEFLTSPIPLELTFNACSHACVYCFANLNQPNRKFNAMATMRLLETYHERQTLTAMLLRAGYPVCVSNRCDPFAASNYRQALPVLRVMVELGIPINIQTRGGPGAEEAMRILPPSVWYITIETDNETLARQLSPGAPAPAARWALAERLIARGDGVILGLNPYVPEWQPDPRPILKRAASIGVWGVWTEMLHLDSKKQTKMLSDYARATLAPVLTKATALHRKGDWPAALERARDIALDYGLEVFIGGQSNHSRFFDIYRRYYPKTFPVLQDYINIIDDDTDALLDFESFAALMQQRLPAGVHPLAHYLGATGHDLWRKYTIPPRMTYRQLLSIIWQEPNTRYALVRSPAFAYAVANNNGARFQIVDETGLPCLSYAQNHPTYYHEIMV